MGCNICEKDKKLIAHHLSYIPEIIIKVCHNCHFMMHRLSEISRNQQDIIFDYVRQYGNLWKNGSEQHHKSEHHRIKNGERSKKYKKEHLAERYLKEFGIEKLMQRIEKMEKRLPKKGE